MGHIVRFCVCVCVSKDVQYVCRILSVFNFVSVWMQDFPESEITNLQWEKCFPCLYVVPKISEMEKSRRFTVSSDGLYQPSSKRELIKKTPFTSVHRFLSLFLYCLS